MTIPFQPNLDVKPEVTAFFDTPTNTVSYVVKDPRSKACAVFDSVMDIDYASGRITYGGADAIITHIKDHGLTLEWLIETHVHADHLSAAPYIQRHLGGRLGIGENITIVQDVFGKIFNEGTEFQRDGSQVDRLFKDGESYEIGAMTAHVMHTPGHTPACTTHVIGDAAFVGDTLFMPDGGSARADFQAAMPAFFIARSGACWNCRAKSASSSATIMAPMAATSNGRPRSLKSACTTSMLATASAKMSLWPCARPATSRSPCRSSSSPRCK